MKRSLIVFFLALIPFVNGYSKLPPVYYPTGYHHITALSALGDSLDIEDGSVWEVAYLDQYRIFYWHTSDPLLLTQNDSWISSYQYKLINQTTGASVLVNLSLGPLLESQYTLFIHDLDQNNRQLILSDGSQWMVSRYDTTSFRKWLAQDAIIIGINTGWDSEYNYILINSNMNQFVRAKQL